MDHVEYKGNQFPIELVFQHFGNGLTFRLRLLNLRDLHITKLNEIEGLENSCVESLLLDRNSIDDLEGIEKLSLLKVLFIGDNIEELGHLDELRFNLTQLTIRGTFKKIKKSNQHYN